MFVLLVLLGLLIGCFGTLVGAGGGFILMPLLLLWRPGEEADRLTALSLFMVLCNAISGSIGYARARRIDYKAGFIFAAAALPGAIAGTLLVDRIPRQQFDYIMAGVLTAIAVFLLWRGEKRVGKSSPSVNEHEANAKPRLGIGAAVSVGVGCIASLLGIGGGIIHVPALVHLVHMPVHIAAATSHFVLAITTSVAVAILANRGMLAGQWDQAIALGVGAVVGAQFGARLSARLPGGVIVRALAIALILAAVRVGWQAATHR